MNRRDDLKTTLKRILAEQQAAEFEQQSCFVPVIIDLLSDHDTIDGVFDQVTELCDES